MAPSILGKVNIIMVDETTNMREALLTVRQQLDIRRIPHKLSAAKAGVGLSTWFSWFPADGTPQVPSLACLAGLANALPGDLLNLLVPDGFYLVPGPRGIDHDDLAAGFCDYLREKEAAHHPASECGRDIGPGEEARLTAKVVALPIKGRVA